MFTKAEKCAVAFGIAAGLIAGSATTRDIIQQSAIGFEQGIEGTTDNPIDGNVIRDWSRPVGKIFRFGK